MPSRADERPSKDRERPTKDRKKIDRGPDGPRRPFEDRLETVWRPKGPRGGVQVGPTQTVGCTCNGTCSFDRVRDARDVSTMGLADEIPNLIRVLGITAEMLSCAMGHAGKGERMWRLGVMMGWHTNSWGLLERKGHIVDQERSRLIRSATFDMVVCTVSLPLFCLSCFNCHRHKEQG